MAEPGKDDKPLFAPGFVRGVAALALVAIAITLIVDFVHGHSAHFGFDGFTGFYAVFGLASGLVIIGVAKGLGLFLTRPDTYYDDKSEPAE
jgi:hypothetical protein